MFSSLDCLLKIAGSGARVRAIQRIAREYGTHHSAQGLQPVCVLQRHPLIRDVPEFVSHTTVIRSVTLAEGSALGVTRHLSRQVPWTLDADCYAILDLAPTFTALNF